MVTDVISVSPKYRLNGKHTINFIGAFSNRHSNYKKAIIQPNKDTSWDQDIQAIFSENMEI